MTEESYQELKDYFYNRTEWIKNKQIRELGFFSGLHYKYFIKWLAFRISLTEKRYNILRRNLEIQERAYVLMSCKILYTEKFKKALLKSLEEGKILK